MTEAADSFWIKTVPLRISLHVANEAGSELIAVIIVTLVVPTDRVVKVLLVDNRHVLHGKCLDQIPVFKREIGLTPFFIRGIIRQHANRGAVNRIDDVKGIDFVCVGFIEGFVELSSDFLPKRSRDITIAEPRYVAFHSKPRHQRKIVACKGVCLARCHGRSRARDDTIGCVTGICRELHDVSLQVGPRKFLVFEIRNDNGEFSADQIVKNCLVVFSRQGELFAARVDCIDGSVCFRPLVEVNIESHSVLDRRNVSFAGNINR